MNGAVDFSYEFGQIEENERLKAQLRMAQRKITSFQSGNNRCPSFHSSIHIPYLMLYLILLFPQANKNSLLKKAHFNQF